MHYTSRTAPHHVRRQLLKCPASYVDSVGRDDIETLGHVADNEHGTGTVLRLVMGATVQMPARALSYVQSAIGCAQILSHQQLQIVHANNLGGAINGIDIEAAREQAELLAMAVRQHSGTNIPSLLHAEDTPLDLAPFRCLAELALAENKQLGADLARKGDKHGGDPIAYAAAHCAFQDTDILTLEPLLPDSLPQVPATAIVSIGCQQERLFYSARMAMRGMAENVQGTPMIPTAQIFTSHLTPPYFAARGGEQSLEDALENGLDLSQAADPSTIRDMQHLQGVMGASV